MILFKRKVICRFFVDGEWLTINQKLGLFDFNDPQLKINFSITRDLSSSPNTGSIKIYNLNQSTRNLVGREFTKIELYAGYEPNTTDSNVSLLFAGQVRSVKHYRQGNEIVTDIQVSDAPEVVWRAYISRTFYHEDTQSVPLLEILEGLFAVLNKNFDIQKGEWNVPEFPDFQRPYSVFGKVATELDYLGKSHGFYWSIQNDVMEIVPSNGYIDDGGYDISAETGMLSTPIITDNGIEVNSLIRPEININRLIRVSSPLLDESMVAKEYRVGKIQYNGGNRDGAFSMNIFGETLDADMLIDEGEQNNTVIEEEVG